MKKKDRKTAITALLGSAGLVLLSCCGQLPDLRSFEDVDLKPPVLLKVVPADGLGLRLVFDEPLSERSVFILEEGPEVTEVRFLREEVELDLSESQIPGKPYILGGDTRDLRGNSLSFLVRFYGFNPSPPDMVINEFINQGSSTHPDVVELKVLSPGNAAGLVLCEGTTDTWSDRFVFPSLELCAGEYLLVHFKPQGIPGEVDETGPGDQPETFTASEGLDASPLCRDFWVSGGDGLAGNNGTLTLYGFPQGPLLDGLLFSNRTSSSDTDYRGFGSRDVLAQAEQLYEEGGWTIGGELIAPEDGINPEDSTATRSICRNRDEPNSRSKTDWHIVPSGGYTLGYENSEEIYTP